MSIIRKKDSAALLAIGMAVASNIPTEVLTNSPEFQRALALVPPSVVWALVGLSSGYWLFHADSEPSRLKALWDRITKKFAVEFFKVGNFENNGPTDLQVKLKVRFLKAGTFRLRLRVFECIGMRRKPWENVIDLGTKTVCAGETMLVDIVDTAFGIPGWDHERKRGWSTDRQRSLIGKSKNVAVFECQGRATQSFKMYIEHIQYDVGQRAHTPSLFVVGEDEDLWDVSTENELGEFRYC